MSRKNQGWPGHDSPHTAQEIIVFSHFDSAGELATALDSEDIIRRDLAVLSMENIRHRQMPEMVPAGGEILKK